MYNKLLKIDFIVIIIAVLAAVLFSSCGASGSDQDLYYIYPAPLPLSIKTEILKYENEKIEQHTNELIEQNEKLDKLIEKQKHLADVKKEIMHDLVDNLTAAGFDLEKVNDSYYIIK